MLISGVAWAGHNDSIPQAIDSVYLSVMIVPYDEKMYLSDADAHISAGSEKNIEDVQAHFRLGLNISLNARVLSQYGNVVFLSEKKDRRDDLYRLYRSVKYQYAAPILPPAPDGPPPSVWQKTKSFFVGIGDKRRAKRAEAPIIEAGLFAEGNTTTYNSNYVGEEYLNAVVKEPRVLAEMHEKYGVELFLFINQLEVKTNFDNCIDLENRIYQRSMVVHYSVYNKTGSQLRGNRVVVPFPENSNRLEDIVRKCIPEASALLSRALPLSY